MSWRTLANPAFIVALAILIAAGAALKGAIETTGAHLQKLPIYPEGRDHGPKFASLPTAVEGWQRIGNDADLSAEVVEELGTQNYLSRIYMQTGGGNGRKIAFELHCAYYTGTIDTVPHVPERCYVGSGMSFDGESTIVPIHLNLDRFPPDRFADPVKNRGAIRQGRVGGEHVHLPRDIENLRMNVTPFLDQHGVKRYAGYFFIANGGTVPKANDVRVLAFKIKDSYAYYAKVQFMSADVSSAEELAEVAADFLNKMLPEIMRRTPDWVEVVEGRYPPDRKDNIHSDTSPVTAGDNKARPV